MTRGFFLPAPTRGSKSGTGRNDEYNRAGGRKRATVTYLVGILAAEFTIFHASASHSYASFLNGMPSICNISRAWSSDLAVVTMVTSMPLNLSILSYSISGKINWSRKPSV